MHRSVALVAFLALSWSQLVALRCDMGEDTAAAAADVPAPASHSATGADAHHHAATPRSHHAAPAGDAPAAPHPTSHGAPHGCLMIMACGVASPRPARPAAMIRIPAVLVRAAFPAPPVAVAAEPAVETPPPRHTV